MVLLKIKTSVFTFREQHQIFQGIRIGKTNNGITDSLRLIAPTKKCEFKWTVKIKMFDTHQMWFISGSV